jgi:UDP-N-acetylmuramoylalanine--D-glutamate ligase
MRAKEFLKGKKALVMGLGVFGGGAASAKWLFSHGAQVTITDMKSERDLEASLKKFTPIEKKNISFVLGEHREKDFLENDIIVVNPGVPKESRFLRIARKAKKQIENDASFFYRFIQNPTIGITGTRGKTTVTAWISAFLSPKYKDVMPSGNTPENALLREISRSKDTKTPAVSELSSWQLEILPVSERAPHVAVITNVFPDHLNRYKDIEEYARAKANIFARQTKEDFLVLNDASKWMPFFVAFRPKARIFFFSKKSLAKNKNGVFVKGDTVIFRRDGKERKIADVKNFARKMGEHNLDNLLAALLSVTLFDPKIRITKKMIDRLPHIPFRQEIIYAKNGLTVINDSAGTSPDAVIAALRRFTTWEFNPRNLGVELPNNIVLITGGTDKKLEFTELAKEIKKRLKPENLILLNGSATAGLITELEKVKFFKKQKSLLFETLDECINTALQTLPKQKGIIVFSPGAASFEKFKNEFHRGEKFTSSASWGVFTTRINNPKK